MTTFLYALIANVIIWIAMVCLIFILRLYKNKIVKYLSYFTAITVWILLWIIFISFIPEIIESGLPWTTIWTVILLWLLVFYILELLLHHHHCHDIELWEHKHNEEHSHESLMFIWTLLHNMLHWLVIYSAFTVSTAFWIATATAVLLHSIPQNTANYIMNHNKEIYVRIAALWWIIWTILLLPFNKFIWSNESLILWFVCGWLLYLTLSDILPEVKNKWWLKIKFLYLLFIFVWLGLVFLLNYLH